jgi:hypothetical protein
VTARLATVDRATDFSGWARLDQEQWAYLEGLCSVQSALVLAGLYELAAEVAQGILGPWPDAPGIRANLAASRAAIDIQQRWRSLEDVWPGAVETGRLSRQQLGLWWRSVRAFDRAPYWDGSPLYGRTLLLRQGFGLGDWLLRARHIRTLVERYGARVVVETEQQLAGLAGTTPFVSEALARDWPDCQIPDRITCAAWCSTHDLPALMDCRPDDPATIPYLSVRPELIDRWRQRLGPLDGRLRVGLIWAADLSHDWGRERSMPLHQLAPLAQVPGVRWYSLQKTGSIRRAWTRPADGGPEAAPAPVGLDLTRLGPELDDLADTGAVLHSLDLLVTVDTSIANLAGGLGIPMWVMLPTRAPAALWGRQSDRCITYPTARLFRQDRPGDWAPVVARVTEALRHHMTHQDAA